MLNYNYKDLRKEVSKIFAQQDKESAQFALKVVEGDDMDTLDFIMGNRGSNEELAAEIKRYDEILFKLSLMGLTPEGFYISYHDPRYTLIHTTVLASLREHFTLKEAKEQDAEL